MHPPHILQKPHLSGGFILTNTMWELWNRSSQIENGVSFSEKSAIHSEPKLLEQFFVPKCRWVWMRIWRAALKTAKPSEHNPLNFCGDSVSPAAGPPRSTEHFKICLLSQQFSLWSFKLFSQHSVKLISTRGKFPSLAFWDTVKIQRVNYLWKLVSLDWTVTDGTGVAFDLTALCNPKAGQQSSLHAWFLGPFYMLQNFLKSGKFVLLNHIMPTRPHLHICDIPFL